MKFVFRLPALFLAVVMASGAQAETRSAAADDPAIKSRLLRAYPEHLKALDGNELIWSDGTRMPFDDGIRNKTFDTLLNSPSLRDEFSMPYPKGPPNGNPQENFDPGRIRYEPFFEKMYGNCAKGEVDRKLASIEWLPKHGGGRLRVTTVNGVHKKLQAVSNELDLLGEEFMKYLKPTAGIYNCRTIAGTSRKSMHAYAAAIDINTKYSHYWMNSKSSDGKYLYRNSIPYEIAAIFEKHGFIWGAKWYHFDIMHFEYRPEILPPEVE